MVPTYNKINEMVHQRYGCHISHPCWIAEVKRKHGLTRGPAWNSGLGKGAPPCPPHIQEAIERILKDCGAI